MPSARILRLREKAAALPLCPGVYLMKDADGTVIYVGKSRHLKNRVSSYFVDTDHGPKTARMVARVEDFDTILCDTEMEALTLENTLIKRYSPRYNIKLKDAKSYPYLKITAEAWPRVVVTRRRVSDGGSYFGPYRSSATAYSALETVSSIFGLPTCRRVFPRDIGRDRPCLYRQMGRCCAPCVPDIDREAYLTLIASAKNVLRGHTREAETELRRRMEAASDELLFELAAHYRDSIAALSRLGEKQKVVSDERAERDVFALWEGPVSGALAVLQIREGKLLYKNEYAYTASELTDGADLAGLLLDYYGDGADVPREILLDREIEAEDREALEELLAGSCGHRVEVRTPKRGDARKLVEMAAENARHHAETKKEGGENRERTLARLAALLGLEVLPARIEAYDISNLGREFATCSMVVWEDGAPKRGDYRTFRIRTTDGQDDYGAMREALSRRLDHIGDGSPSLGVCPDLILLDGGAGHVGAVRPLVEARGLPVPVFGMVKDDFHKTRCLTDAEGEISIAREQAVFVLVYSIQEEAHRAAVRAMTGAKRRTLRRSSLEDIPGIGPKKAASLLGTLGSLAAVRAADPDALARAAGVSATDALTVYRHFHPSDAEAESGGADGRSDDGDDGTE